MMLAQQGGGGGGLLEEVVVIGGLLVAQCVLAGYVVFVDHVLRLGADPLAVIVVAAVASSAFFLPFAVALERKKWPRTISRSLMAQLVLIALGGITVFQGLMLLGIKKTTPAIASAMPNLSTGLIFIIAACFRLERFDKACKYSQAKMAGTCVCLVGAMAMSLLQSPTRGARRSSFGGDDWILGCSYLLAAVAVLSFNTVLQAATLSRFPVPLTLCSVTAMMGAIFTAILQVVVEGRMSMGSPRIGLLLVAGIAILGGGVVGGCVVFQTWCLGKKGPLLVSIFGPVQTVCSAAFSAILLPHSQALTLPSMAGIGLMFCGLYIVLWAKSKEVISQQAADVEKPLLS